MTMKGNVDSAVSASRFIWPSSFYCSWGMILILICHCSHQALTVEAWKPSYSISHQKDQNHLDDRNDDKSNYRMIHLVKTTKDTCASSSSESRSYRRHPTPSSSLSSSKIKKDSQANMLPSTMPLVSPSYPVFIHLRGGEIDDSKNDQLDGSIIEEPANIIELDSIVEQANQDGHLVVIDFWSDDCPPCERVAPLYKELSMMEEFQEKVVFCKIKVSDHPLIVSQYNVTGWPTFLFIKHGKVQTEIVGGKLAEATLYDWVRLLMPKESSSESNNDDNDDSKH